MLVRESKTLRERVTLELDLEELIKVWGGSGGEGSCWQSKLSMFRIQGLFKEGNFSVMAAWGEGWHKMTVEREVIQVIRGQLGVPWCPLNVVHTCS